MRTYYRGRDAMVTSERFVGRASSVTSFAIRDLRNVCIARDQAGGSATRPLIAAAVGFLCLLGAVTGWAAGSPYAALLLALATPIGVAAAFLWPRRPTRWELRASYRGRTVSLYSSCDAMVFNQVTRALRRAVEEQRRPLQPAADDAA